MCIFFWSSDKWCWMLNWWILNIKIISQTNNYKVDQTPNNLENLPSQTTLIPSTVLMASWPGWPPVTAQSTECHCFPSDQWSSQVHLIHIYQWKIREIVPGHHYTLLYTMLVALSNKNICHFSEYFINGPPTNKVFPCLARGFWSHLDLAKEKKLGLPILSQICASVVLLVVS